MNINLPRCGDYVWHGPSRRNVQVAWVDGDWLATSEWRDGRVRLVDCQIMYKCSDAEHQRMVEVWRKAGHASVHRAKVLKLYGRHGQR